MKKFLNFLIAISLSPLAIFISCNKSDELKGNPESLSINKTPVAKAGLDIIISLPQDSVLLDGTGSYDPDGTINKFYWSKISGPASCLIVDPEAAMTMAKNLVLGVYKFELTITDNGGLKTKDVVQVVVLTENTTGSGGTCDISNRPHIDATLTMIGTLSFPQAPYVAAAGNKIVFGGGGHDYSYVDIYDVNTYSWQRTLLSQARTNMAVIGCGNKIFFAGGNNHDNWYDIVDIYDVKDESWTVAHLSEPESVSAAAAVGDKVFFAGGITEEGFNQTNSIDIYDISDDSWTTAVLSEPKFGVTAVTSGTKVYFAGGLNYLSWGSPVPPQYNTIDIYDAATETWSTSRLNVITGEVSGVAIGNKIYWAGMSPGQSDGYLEIWDTQNGMVTTSCLSYARSYPRAVVKNDDIVIFTPSSHINFYDNFDVYGNQFDIYNTLSGHKSVGILEDPLVGAAIITVNNIIYVAGGKTANGLSNRVYTLSW